MKKKRIYYNYYFSMHLEKFSDTLCETSKISFSVTENLYTDMLFFTPVFPPTFEYKNLFRCYILD